MFNPKSVAIVGAGPAGISSLAYFVSKGVQVVAYESRESVGGIWTADDSSPIYNCLRTQTPAETMRYVGVPFGPKVEQFPHHSVVLNYLNSFVVTQNLTPYIRLRTRVVSISASEDDRWRVVSQEITDENRIIEHIDFYNYVLVASGHYSQPYVPEVQGLDSFTGRAITAKEWRGAEEMLSSVKDGIILVVGGGASGTDIVRQISKYYRRRGVKKTIYQSLRSCQTSERVGNLQLIGSVTKLSSGVVFFKHQGQEAELQNVELIVFATGYEYVFPFIDHTQEPFSSSPLLISGKRGEKNRLANLDMLGLSYLPRPSLGFSCLQNNVISFLLAPLQASCLYAIWFSHIPNPLGHLPDVPTDNRQFYYNYDTEPEYYCQLINNFLTGKEKKAALDMLAQEKWRWEVRKSVQDGWIIRRDSS